MVPPGQCGLSEKKLVFPVYFESVLLSDPKAMRTYLIVLPTKTHAFQDYFSAIRSYIDNQAEEPTNKFNIGKVASRFATKLHAYKRLHPIDMERLCKNGGVTQVLKQAFYSAYERCISRKRTGRPSSSKKISFSTSLSEFNAKVQLDFFFIVESLMKTQSSI